MEARRPDAPASQARLATLASQPAKSRNLKKIQRYFGPLPEISDCLEFWEARRPAAPASQARLATLASHPGKSQHFENVQRNVGHLPEILKILNLGRPSQQRPPAKPANGQPGQAIHSSNPRIKISKTSKEILDPP